MHPRLLLRERLRALVKESAAEADSSTRRIARRTTRGTVSRFNSGKKRDAQYQAMLEELGLKRSAR